MEWFNNQLGVAGYPGIVWASSTVTIGGPVIIPKVRFNKDHNRLFFFYSGISNGITPPPGLNKYTMPTSLERQGDFSQSFNTSGTPILVRDPLSGAACSLGWRSGLLPDKIPLTVSAPSAARC